MQVNLIPSLLFRRCTASAQYYSLRHLSSIFKIYNTQHEGKEREVIDRLSLIKEPVTSLSLLSLGLIHSVKINSSLKHVDQVETTVLLDSLMPGYTDTTSLTNLCLEALKQLPWICHDDLTVRMIDREPRNLSASDDSVLARVEHIIAVSSCKGGVGKSTVAVNLATHLAKSGLRVGILDADIYGPSLPFMIEIESSTILKSPQKPKFILPLISKYGLKAMSFGFVNPNAGVAGAGGKDASVIRGPIASRVINQLLCATDWGSLDYLIVDMPPGTGDVQITLAQSAFFTGAVVVTTPHPLSIADVSKGIEMFRQVKVPILCIVENMAYFTCNLGNKYFPFGRAGKEFITTKILTTSSLSTAASSSVATEASGCWPVISVPMYMSSDADTDKQLATPNFQIERPETEEVYLDLCKAMLREIFKQLVNVKIVPSVAYVENRGVILRYFTPTNAVEFIIPKEELRKRDPRTGEYRAMDAKGLDNLQAASQSAHKFPLSPSPTATPVQLDIRGNYGVAITWSDGHHVDIFPFEILKKIATTNK